MKRIRLTILFLCSVISLAVQGQTSHWICDAYAYQYDMTVYLSVSNNGKPLADMSDYEIAGFCGNECRGVAEILSLEKNGKTVQYAYLRIRSNSAEGENITFKVFTKAINQEYEIENANITFKSQLVTGLPSSPMILELSQQNVIATIKTNEPFINVARREGWIGSSDTQMTQSQAEAVTTMGTAFRGNTEIITLNELEYFTNVTKIDAHAFNGCQKMTAIRIPDTITEIGDSAFYYCKALTDFYMPSSVQKVGRWGFAYCTGLKKVIISDIAAWCNITFTGNYATPLFFAKHLYLGNEEIIDLVIPDGVETIENYVFWGGNSLKSIAIPSSVKIIKAYSFAQCYNLTSITIPSSVTSIHVNPFSGCRNLTSIVVESGNKYYDSRNNCNAIIRTSDNLLITGCQTTKIPSDVTTLNTNAFNGQTALTTFYIPSSITKIGNNVFESCSNLTSVSIPSHVTSIGTNLFLYCTKLTKVTCHIKEPFAIDSSVFTDNTKNEGTLYVPTGTKEKYEATDGWKEFKNIVEMAAPEPYAVLSDDGKTVTFYYDVNKSNRGGIDINNSDVSGSNSPYGTATTAVIDASFADYQPTSTAYWFYKCSSLTSIKGMENLHTDNVTDMNWMFWGCSGLTSLDVSGFKTDNVTNMSSMFSGCSGLTSLDVSGFKTDNVTNMWGIFNRCSSLTNLDVSGFETEHVTNTCFMFSECSSLTSLDVSGFKTDNVTSMWNMFYKCSSLTSLDVSGFKTDNVTDMWCMFAGCSGLTSLDVSGFKTDNVTYMECMFSGCSKLKTIYAGSGWSTEKVPTNGVMGGGGVFSDCTSLVGGKGTAYDASHTDYTYARIDGGETQPGYFTKKGAEPTASEPYAAMSDNGKTVTFFYDGNKACRGGVGINNTYQQEFSPYSGATTAVIDASFANYRPTSTACWFQGCSSLTTIMGIEILHTDNVTDMKGMFYDCSALTSLDVSGFKTDNVTDMNGMFYDCSGLTSLDVSGFKTDKVTDMCGMFFNCSGLTSLDVSGFKTDNVKNMNVMFAYCSSLKTIYASSGWSTENVTRGNNMYYGCTSLVGGKGTAYDESHTNRTYARIDKEGQPGYLTEKSNSLTPLSEDKEDYNSDDEGQYDDLDGNVIGNILYSIDPTDGGYNKSEGCIEVTKPTSDDDMDAIAGKDPFGEDVRSNFTGIIFMVSAGKGTIKVNAETTGGMLLKVKIGNAEPMEMELDGKLKATFPYNVSKPTYVYIYAGTIGGAAVRGVAEPSSLKIYGIEWQSESVKGDLNGDGNVDVGDIMAIINYMAAPTGEPGAYDLNGDGNVDVGDIMAIINIMAAQ